MRKALLLTGILALVLALVVGCAQKSPEKIIVGDWTGEATFAMPKEDAETQEFTATFTEDGNCTFTPKEEESPAEGTYEITETGEITAMITLPDVEREVELTGKLDVETEALSLTGMFGPTDEEYAMIKENFDMQKTAAEEAGEEFTDTLPTKEDLTATMTFDLTKATEEKEE